MPPKGKGGGATRKIFDKAAQNLMNNKLAEEYDGNPCLRCGLCVHHHTLDCWDQFKPQQHWSKGAWNYENKEEKRRLEAYFQVEQKKRVDSGNFKTKFKKEPASKPETSTTPGDAPAKIPGPSNLPSRPAAPRAPIPGSNNPPSLPATPSRSLPGKSDVSSSATSSGNVPAAVKKRELKHTEGVGKSLYQRATVKPIADPDVAKDGVPDIITAPFGPEVGKGDLSVITNYLRVPQIPEKLHVYSLGFWRQSKVGTTPVQLNKKREIQHVFEEIESQLRLDELDRSWATDYKDLWCNIQLTGDAGETQQWNTPEVDCKLLDGKTYPGVYVSVNYTGVLDNIPHTLATGNITEVSDHIRALNAYVARFIREHRDRTTQSITQLGANKFYLNRGFKEMTNKGQNLGLRAVRGYYTSIRPGAQGPLLNINVATTAFLKPCLVSEMLTTLNNNRNYVERMLRGARVKITYKRQEYEETEGQEFSMNDDLPRTKIFQQFGEVASLQKFFTVLERNEDDPNSERSVADDDNGTSVLQYFKNIPMDVSKKFGNDLLCVNVGKRVHSFRPGSTTEEDMKQQTIDGAQWIPACFLEILPYQPMTGQMDADHTRAMMDHALHLPAENAGLIDAEGLEVLGVKSQSITIAGPSSATAAPASASQANPNQATANIELQDLGFELGSNLITLRAQRLKTPTLFCEKRADSTVPHIKNDSPNTKLRLVPHIEKASWSLTSAAFTNPMKVAKIHVLGLDSCFHPRQRDESLELIRDDFVKQLCEHHVFTTGDYVQMQARKDHQLEEELDDWFALCAKDDCTLILLKSKNYDKHAAIKRTSDFSGYHTICAVGEKFRKKELNPLENGGRLQHFSNLALKVNMKMGGDNYWLEPRVLDSVLGNTRNRKSTMIMGSDVTHPGAGSKIGTPSIACVVGTIDDRFMSYRGSMRLQPGGQEQIEENNLRSMIKERLEAWKANNNGNLPETILWYRDGVSESQLSTISHFEIPEIEKAYAELSGTTNEPKIMFMVVGKRHNTRFYAKNEADTYTSYNKNERRNIVNGNLKPGLLVSDVVTAPGPTNFFLQSHCAIKGTARSAHYYILHNTTNISVRNLQELTMMLCYTFGRSTTGVSYAAPAYIADRLCDRGRAYLRPWAEDKFAQPVFEYNQHKDAQGKKRKSTDTEIKAEKQDMINKLLKSWVWNANYNDGSDTRKPTRLNPWHENLDGGMFWI